MRVNAISCECDLEQSKLFGEAYLPEEWLEQDLFSIYEFFLGQINLSEFSVEGLPTKGYLYFFVETTNFKKMKAVVRLFDGEPSACTDFNDGLFEENQEYLLTKDKFGEIELFETQENLVKLISIPSHVLPFDCDFSRLCITIDKTNLLAGNYDACKLIFD